MRVAVLFLSFLLLGLSVVVFNQVKPATTNCGGTDVSHLNSKTPSTNVAFFPNYIDKLFLNPNKHPTVPAEAESTLGCSTVEPQKFIPIDALAIGVVMLLFAVYPRNLLNNIFELLYKLK